MPGKMFECKYKPEYPALFIKTCKDGGSICDFCAGILITRQTFYNWVDNYPEFREAFETGKLLTEAWLTKKGIEGMQSPGFNATVWSILMRNKCGYAEHRKIAIDFTGCKTANEKFEVLNQRVSEGRLSVTEARHMAEYIAASVKIDENTEGKQRLEAVEESLGIKK